MAEQAETTYPRYRDIYGKVWANLAGYPRLIWDGDEPILTQSGYQTDPGEPLPYTAYQATKPEVGWVQLERDMGPLERLPEGTPAPEPHPSVYTCGDPAPVSVKYHVDTDRPCPPCRQEQRK